MRWILAAALCVGLSIAYGQSSQSVTISGTVTDPTGAGVANAEVIAILASVPDICYDARTGDEGGFHLASLATGTYELRFLSPGFATARSTVTAHRDTDAGKVELKVANSGGPMLVNSETNEPMLRSICELTKTPDRFDGKTVQVFGRVNRDGEELLLTDPGCAASVRLVADKEKTDELRGSCRYIGVTVTGKFHQSKITVESIDR